MTPVSSEKYAALLYFERPRSRVGLDPALAAEADWLITRDFLIEHEGKLLSVVVRPRPAIAAVVARSADRRAANPQYSARPMHGLATA
jgi:hypothetical protein